MIDDLVTRSPGLVVSSKPQIVNNQYYDADSSLYDEDGTEIKHEISNDAVIVTSPSPSSYADRISSYNPTYSPYPTRFHRPSSQTFATELPNYIQSSPGYSEEDENNLIQFSKEPYDHSDISHASVEADVLEGDDNFVSSGYLMPTTASHALATETRTEAPIVDKNKFSNPIFKQKPTQQAVISTEKYVLVHTITNDNNKQGEESQPTKKPSSSTNESIQSIILMLNGSNSNNKGPEYSHGESTTPTSGYPSTSMIDYNKYGSSSYYVTTKKPEKKTSVKVGFEIFLNEAVEMTFYELKYLLSVIEFFL